MCRTSSLLDGREQPSAATRAHEGPPKADIPTSDQVRSRFTPRLQHAWPAITLCCVTTDTIFVVKFCLGVDSDEHFPTPRPRHDTNHHRWTLGADGFPNKTHCPVPKRMRTAALAGGSGYRRMASRQALWLRVTRTIPTFPWLMLDPARMARHGYGLMLTVHFTPKALYQFGHGTRARLVQPKPTQTTAKSHRMYALIFSTRKTLSGRERVQRDILWPAGGGPLPKLSKPITFETAFGAYKAEDVLGQGGAGVAYGGNIPRHLVQSCDKGIVQTNGDAQTNGAGLKMRSLF